MTSPAVGIGYYLWRRGRHPLYAAVACLLLLAAVVRWVPVFAEAGVGLPATAPLAVLLTHLYGVLVLDATAAGSRASGFPAHMLTLPVNTASLVGWPMLYMAVFAVVSTALVSRLILAPLEVALFPMAPLVIGVCAAWMQALFWCPSPVPGLRVVLFGPLIGAVGVGAAAAGGAAWPLPLKLAAFATMWLAAFAAARTGLSVARRGGGSQPMPMLLRWRSLRAATPARPFRTPAAAQMWYEWRRTIPVLPMFALGSGAMLTACAALGAHAARRHGSPTPFAVGGVEVTPPLIFTCAFLAGPIMLSSMVSNLGRSEFFARNPALPAFLAVRPMSSTEYVGLKFRALTLTTLGTWALTLLLLALALGMYPPRERLALPALLYQKLGHAWAPLALIVAGLAYFTWRNGAIQLWFALAGRPALVTGVTLTTMGLFGCSGLVGYWFYHHPAALAVVRPMGAHLLEILALVKCMAAAGVGVALVRARLLPARVIAITVAGWLLVAVPVGLGTRHFFPSFAHAAALAILLVPLTRLLAAPLAFHWNRHR